MRITAFGRTDRGRRRPNNEDDLAVVDLTEGRTLPDHSAEHLQANERGGKDNITTLAGRIEA